MKHPPKYKESNKPDKEPNPNHVTEEQVLAYLATIANPESVRQIAHGMELRHHGRRFLPRILQHLEGRGDIEKIHGGQYRLAETKHSVRAAAKRGKAAPSEGREIPQAPAARRSNDPNLIAGRMVAHRDGYGFVVPDSPIPRPKVS